MSTAITTGAHAPPLQLRRWQAEAIPLALADVENAEGGRGVVVATTGGGKSIALAEMLRRYIHAWPDRADERIVVTTPTRKLVEQLSETFAKVLGAHNVGRYYTKAKQWRRPVVVCCNPSVPALAEVLRSNDMVVGLWIADECHRTESDRMIVEPEEGADLDATDIVDVLGAKRIMGFTATPQRSNERESLRLYTHEIYRYPPADALRDGVIVPWRVVGWDEDREQSDPDEVCAIMIAELGDRATRGPGVVNATTIEDAERYVTFLGQRGIVAEAIHSKLRDAEQTARIERLRAGELDCLVHVSMLVEGVDFPWLRWGCLRRPVGARIRFIQEVGRYIRSFPGKTEAVLLDPHDLFGTFQLTYEASLGWVEAEDIDPTTLRERKEIEDAEAKEPRERRAVRTSALGRYVRQVYLSLLAEGVASAGKVFGSAGALWRQDDPTPEQLRKFRGSVKKWAHRLAEPHRTALAKVATTGGIATKGIVSDGISLFDALAATDGEWTPAADVPLPPDAAYEAIALPLDTRWYTVGACRGGTSAVCVVHAGDIVVNKSRPYERGDTWASLTLCAVAFAVVRGAKEVVVADAESAAMISGEKAPTRKAAEYLSRMAVRPVAVVDKAKNPASRMVWKSLPRPTVPE
jgi:superfamily II DNA or RNA helicase